MRVVLTNPYCWPHVRRGSESAMHGLASWLRRHGHDASILAGHREASTYEIDGVPYETVRAPNGSRYYRELTPAVTLVPAMTRVLRRTRPDVVHAFLYQDGLAARFARVPYVISYAGIIAPRSWHGLPLQRRMFDAASRGANAIFCPSCACGSAMARDYGYPNEIIPYGFDTASFAPRVPKQGRRILCAATPDDSRKRADFLVRAFALVAARDPDVELVFAASARPDIQARLRALAGDAATRLVFLGNIDREELRDEFARASVSALTSVNEAFGLVLIESMAAGTPVVGTRSGAIPELVTDDVGATFEPDDIAGCAAALERVLAETGPAMSERCIAHARRYDWDAVAPLMVDLYERVLASQNSSDALASR